jgi:iron complex outermembrane recepter protein
MALGAGSFAGMLLCAGGVLAQQAGTSSPTVTDAVKKPAADSGVTGLDEIIVTARRREENVQTVPIAVSVLSSTELSRENIVSVADLTSHVPSLTVMSATGGTPDASAFFIRGQGEAYGGSDPGVVSYFAEVPTIASGPGLIFDLNNIEVLKGPQGTLFGKNTTGGAIVFQPVKPGNEFGGYLDVTTGDYDLKRYQAAADIPIVNDKVLLRVAMDVNRRDGYTTDALTGRQYGTRDYQAYRVSLVIRPTEDLENYTVAFSSESNGTMGGTILTAVNPNGPYPQLLPLLAAQQARGVRSTELGATADYSIMNSYGLSNITTWKANDALTVKNIAGYRLFEYKTGSDIDGTPLPITDGYPLAEWGSGAQAEPSQIDLTDELQIQGDFFSHRLSTISGLYYSHQQPESNNNEDAYIVNGGGPLIFKSLLRERSEAVYSQATYDLSDWVSNLKLTGGARYTKDSRSETSSEYFGTPSAGCLYTIPSTNCVLGGSADFHATTWNVSLDYQIAPQSLLYATARRGYKSGGFNDITSNPDLRIFKPEFVTDVEIGSKNEFHLGSAPTRFNIDVFRSVFSNWQEAGIVKDPTNPLGGSDVTVNAAGGVIGGVETEFTVAPVHWFELSGFYAYTDAYFTSNVFNGIDIASKAFTGIARNKFGLTADTKTNLGDSIGVFEVSATYSYQSQMYFNFEPLLAFNPDPQHGQAAYGLLNLNAVVHHVGGSALDVSAFVTNATNKVYKIFEQSGYASSGYSSADYGEPRMFGVELRIPFGSGANK